MYDVVYWATRNNLQRETVDEKNISLGVGYNQAAFIIADAGGILISSYLLYTYGITAFVISAIGMLASFIPIMFIKTQIQIQNKDFKIWELFKKRGLKTLATSKKMYVIFILMLTGILYEIIDIFFPFLVAYSNINMLETGIILSIFSLSAFISSIFVGKDENRSNNRLLYLFGLVLLTSIIIFLFLDQKFVGVFLAILGALGTPLLTSMRCKGQKFVKQQFPGAEGGYVLEFIDDASRAFAYIIPFLLLSFSLLSQFKNILLSACFIIVCVLLLIVYKNEK